MSLIARITALAQAIGADIKSVKAQITAAATALAANVRGTVLTGLSVATNSAVTATDTVLVAAGKLQAQITAAASAFAANVLGTVLTGFVTTSSAVVTAADTVLVAFGKLQAQVSLAYTKANILGTVSQTSGVPTGAIIETGTNANGTYTKFADGTMDCHYMGARLTTSNSIGSGFYSSPVTSFTFPAAFVGTVPKVTPLTANSVNNVTWGTTQGDTALTGVGLYALSTSASATALVGYVAKGRWIA